MKRLLYLLFFLPIPASALGPFVGYVQNTTSTIQSGGFSVQSGNMQNMTVTPGPTTLPYLNHNQCLHTDINGNITTAGADCNVNTAIGGTVLQIVSSITATTAGTTTSSTFQATQSSVTLTVKNANDYVFVAFCGSVDCAGLNECNYTIGMNGVNALASPTGFGQNGPGGSTGNTVQCGIFINQPGSGGTLGPWDYEVMIRAADNASLMHYGSAGETTLYAIEFSTSGGGSGGGGGGGGGGSGGTALTIQANGTTLTSQTSLINAAGPEFVLAVNGSSITLNLNPNTTDFIQNTGILQAGTSYYVYNGNVSNNLTVGSNLAMTHSVPGTSYMTLNDTNIGQNIDYLFAMQENGNANGYLGFTNTSSVGGASGSAFYDQNKVEICRFDNNDNLQLGTSAGISRANILGNMTIGTTFPGTHGAGTQSGYAAPNGGLIVEGQTVIAGTTPLTTNQLTVNNGIGLIGTPGQAGSDSLTEGSTTSVTSSLGADVLWADSVQHWFIFNPNATSSYTIVGSSIVPTTGHFASWSARGALIDGGTGGTAGIFNQAFEQVGSTASPDFLQVYTSATLRAPISVINVASTTWTNVSSFTASGVYFDLTQSTMVVGPITVNGLVTISTMTVSSGTFTGISANQITVNGTSSNDSLILGTGTITQVHVSSSGHINTINGQSPTIINCGTSPTVNPGCNDNSCTINVGSSAGGCDFVFGTPYNHVPTCNVTEQTGSILNIFKYTVTQSSVSVNQTALSADGLDIECMGHD